MKKFIIMALIVSALMSSGTARGLGQSSVKPTEAEFDGWLVAVDTGSAALFSVSTDDLYRVETLEEAEMMAEALPVRYIEPNYRAVLFDEIIDNGDNWPYDVLNVDFPLSYGIDGSGVRAALIDSGIDADNQALAAANIAVGYDYVNDVLEVSDTVYHGTKVAQVIEGIAAGAELVPLECFTSTGGGTVDILSRAIRDAVDVYGCDVINMSWGLSADSQTLREAIEYAADAGAILVAAAGNVTGQFPQGTVLYPAAWDEVIGVGSIDDSLTVSAKSQQTRSVFVCAPGVKIPFIDAKGEKITNSGTSFAAPAISAELALARQLIPSLTAGQAQSLLMERAEDLGQAGYDTAYGWGWLSAESLLGDPWAAVSRDGDSVTVSAWQLTDGAVAAAAYDGDGKMTDLRMTLTGNGVWSAEWEMENAPEVKLYRLGKGYRPLCPASEK